MKRQHRAMSQATDMARAHLSYGAGDRTLSQEDNKKQEFMSHALSFLREEGTERGAREQPELETETAPRGRGQGRETKRCTSLARLTFGSPWS